MPEYAHHYNWLHDTLILLGQTEAKPADTTVRGQLEEGLRLCHRILDQNPASELAQKTLERISAVLEQGGSPSSVQAASQDPVRNLPQSLDALHTMVRPDLVAKTPQEQKLDEDITRFEKSFLEWGDAALLPLLQRPDGAQMGRSAIHAALSHSLELVRRNSANPMKNSEVAMRVASELHLPDVTLLTSQPDPHHFAYGALHDEAEQKGILAGFAGLSRMMAFSKRIDFTSSLDMLVVMHETFHVPQQAKWRHAMGLPSFFHFFVPPPGNKPRVIIDDEYQAYGLEVEAADLLLDGELRRAAAEKRSPDLPWVMHKLKGRTGQEGLAKMICDLAAVYFPAGNAANGTYSQPFKNGVTNICIRDGYQVYESRGGQLVQINA